MPERTDELEQLLRDANRGVFGLTHDVVRQFQLSPGARPVIHCILMEPGTTISEISRKTDVAKSHVSKIVEGLSQRGMLEKRADPSDRRLYRIYLTGRAAEHFEAVRIERRRRLALVVAELPPGKLDELIDGLRALKHALDTQSGKCGDAGLPANDRLPNLGDSQLSIRQEDDLV